MDELEVITEQKVPDGFSWLRIAKITGIIVFFGAVAAGVYFFVAWNPVKAAWASLVRNRRDVYLDCEHLPFNALVEKTFSKHSDIVDKVKAVPGVRGFAPEEIRCRNYEGGIEFIKGDALLTYNSRAARTQAEAILGKDFFGMAYRGEPVK